jgi:hypothetical protein
VPTASSTDAVGIKAQVSGVEVKVFRGTLQTRGHHDGDVDERAELKKMYTAGRGRPGSRPFSFPTLVLTVSLRKRAPIRERRQTILIVSTLSITVRLGAYHPT